MSMPAVTCLACSVKGEKTLARYRVLLRYDAKDQRHIGQCRSFLCHKHLTEAKLKQDGKQFGFIVRVSRW
jgi:hypothetical protein